MGHYSSHVQGIQREDKAFEGTSTLEALALDTTGSIGSVGVASSTEGAFSSDAISSKSVFKPNRDSLRFVVTSAEAISSASPIQGDFMYRPCVLW